MQILTTVVVAVTVSDHILAGERDVVFTRVGRRFILGEQPHSNHFFIFLHLFC
jgi:hypothetical protein